MKLLSGRYLLTVVASIVFRAASSSGYLAAVDVKEILMMIVIFYFSKERGKNGQS